MHKILLTIFLLVFNVTFAQEEELSKEEKERREKNIQAGNPFAEFGYKAKVATLSNGKYLEVHDLDSIVKIGSSFWHVRKQKIVGSVQQDTTDMYRQPLFETAGRWLSPDPLAEEFPEWSPYNYTMNNPIRYTDPTGLAPEDCCNGIIPGSWLGTAGYTLKRTSEVVSRKFSGESWASAYANTYKDDGKNILRYATPVEDIYGIAYGKDFDGNEYNRAEAGGWALASVVPFAKIGKLGKLGKVVTKNGDEIFQASANVSDAFKEATRAGGKHSGMLENVLKLDMTPSQIETSIDTYMNGKRGILTHKDKLANPQKYVENWDNLRSGHQQSLIKGWQTEIQNGYEKIDILTDLLNK